MIESLDMFSVTAQALGWIASIIAICSYGCKDFRRVRIVNLIGAIFFVAYGVMIVAPAIVIGNATIGAIQFAYLASHDRIGNTIAKHRAATWGLFGIYAVTMIAWTVSNVLSGATVAAELLGTASAVGLAAGFLMSDERKMRIICSICSAGNVAYAGLIASAQMALTNAVALGVNVWRMAIGKRETRLAASGEDASAKNRCDEAEAAGC